MSDPVNDILVSLRDKVMGVTESTLATVDGLVVASDVSKTHAESMAAVAAATLSLGRRLADQASTGTLREMSAQCSAGHVIVTAVGERALLAVMTDEGLDLAAFRREMPALVAELGGILDSDTPD
ncbi:roadblock/LC7 domain-containing protein [Streptomyces griseoruber]|uniref:Dynein regulation protein LC7 n=1 Tax=Streptomyces griseoruber TaxID=1943 RepID=A0A101SLF8_9ACTN|nr:roadblock/LC7 domain-containing protein [Streptomyces griseoruber]KUN76362.1 dynein regulation protein LC7 [Streptomyces griseoruber]